MKLGMIIAIAVGVLLLAVVVALLAGGAAVGARGGVRALAIEAGGARRFLGFADGRLIFGAAAAPTLDAAGLLAAPAGHELIGLRGLTPFGAIITPVAVPAGANRAAAIAALQAAASESAKVPVNVVALRGRLSSSGALTDEISGLQGIAVQEDKEGAPWQLFFAEPTVLAFIKGIAGGRVVTGFAAAPADAAAAAAADAAAAAAAAAAPAVVAVAAMVPGAPAYLRLEGAELGLGGRPTALELRGGALQLPAGAPLAGARVLQIPPELSFTVVVRGGDWDALRKREEELFNKYGASMASEIALRYDAGSGAITAGKRRGVAVAGGSPSFMLVDEGDVAKVLQNGNASATFKVVDAAEAGAGAAEAGAEAAGARGAEAAGARGGAQALAIEAGGARRFLGFAGGRLIFGAAAAPALDAAGLLVAPAGHELIGLRGLSPLGAVVAPAAVPEGANRAAAIAALQAAASGSAGSRLDVVALRGRLSSSGALADEISGLQGIALQEDEEGAPWQLLFAEPPVLAFMKGVAGGRAVTSFAATPAAAAAAAEAASGA